MARARALLLPRSADALSVSNGPIHGNGANADSTLFICTYTPGDLRSRAPALFVFPFGYERSTRAE